MSAKCFWFSAISGDRKIAKADAHVPTPQSGVPIQPPDMILLQLVVCNGPTATDQEKAKGRNEEKKKKNLMTTSLTATDQEKSTSPSTKHTHSHSHSLTHSLTLSLTHSLTHAWCRVIASPINELPPSR